MSALGDKLRFWANVVVECNRRDHTNTLSQGNQRGPFRSARALGMAMAALHDAFAIASGRAPLIAGLPASPAMPNAELAAAAACRAVLVKRYPLLFNYVDGAWRNWLEVYGLNAQAGSPSAKFGESVGIKIEAIGVLDPGWAQPNQYTPTGAPYTHDRPANEPNQMFSGGTWGSAKHLLANHVTGFPPPPGRVDDDTVNQTAHFVLDFDKTKSKGKADRELPDPDPRTLAEEITGIFWGYDGPQELGTPPRFYMHIVLSILDDYDTANAATLSDYDELQIAAACAVALADAGIDAWYYKYSSDHMMWRPCLGIPGAVAGNGVADPLWGPLGRPDTNGTGIGLTPDFPSYPSGHATFGAAAFQLLRLMLVQKGVATFDAKGLDNIAFDITSDEYNGRNMDPRTRLPRDVLVVGYPTLWKAIVDNSVSRVYLGVHWQFDGVTIKGANPDGEFGVPATPSALGKTGGVWLGCQIADQIAAKVGVTPATIAKSKV